VVLAEIQLTAASSSSASASAAATASTPTAAAATPAPPSTALLPIGGALKARETASFSPLLACFFARACLSLQSASSLLEAGGAEGVWVMSVRIGAKRFCELFRHCSETGVYAVPVV